MDDHPQSATASTEAESQSEPESGPQSEAQAGPPSFDSAGFRQAVGEFATGVTVVTTLNGSEPKGMTVNSFSSVSLDPPMVLWNVGQDAESFDAFMTNDAFALHILHAGQKDIAKLFATRGADKFADTPWHKAGNGIPVLDDCLVSLECQVAHRYPGGDHTIIVGTVTQIHWGQPLAPLVFHQGRFS